MRITPNLKYENLPCSQVAIGCAYEDVYNRKLSDFVYVRLKNIDGYATLKDVNAAIRDNLPISKKIYFTRKERVPLENFLETNKRKCVVCVLGHYIFVDGRNYYSFFDNEKDVVVCVWFINTDLIEKRKNRCI